MELRLGQSRNAKPRAILLSTMLRLVRDDMDARAIPVAAAVRVHNLANCVGIAHPGVFSYPDGVHRGDTVLRILHWMGCECTRMFKDQQMEIAVLDHIAGYPRARLPSYGNCQRHLVLLRLLYAERTRISCRSKIGHCKAVRFFEPR